MPTLKGLFENEAMCFDKRSMVFATCNLKCYSCYAFVNPQLSWFVLGAMSALCHVVFIWFHFKKQNEYEEKATGLEIKPKENLKNENNINKKTLKTIQNERNKKMNQ